MRLNLKRLALGLGISIKKRTLSGGGAVVPANAIRDRAGNYILDRSNDYILTRT